MTRKAISPRFAIRTFLNKFCPCGYHGCTAEVAKHQESPAVRASALDASERNVSVLFRGILVALGLQRLERINESRPRVARIDDVVEISSTGRDVRVRELLPVLLDLSFSCRRFVRTLRDFLPEEDFHRTLWSHHRDLGRRPGDVEVAANVL